jgi:hypothetical protein
MSFPEEPRDYPPFSGDDPVCPKCYKIGASTEYREYGECVHDLMNAVVGFGQNQRLHRECLRCGYSWDEHTAVPEKVSPHP